MAWKKSNTVSAAKKNPHIINYLNAQELLRLLKFEIIWQKLDFSKGSKALVKIDVYLLFYEITYVSIDFCLYKL